jgi:hypothetical protein
VTAHVEVAEMNMDKNQVKLTIWRVNQDGVKILEGYAMVSQPKK